VALQAKGAAPRKQHYVPQFYLRKFTGAKDMLLVFDREKKETYRSKPFGVAAQRDFNRIDVDGMDANAVEKVLSEFEGETAPHLERVIANKSIADQGDRSAMVNLMAAMTLRNPKRRQVMGEVIGNFAKNFFGRKDNYEKYVAGMKKVGKEPEFTLEEVRNELTESTITVPKESIIAAEIDQHDHATKLLWDKKWQIVVAPDNSGGFVTTDDPVCIRWTDGQEHADRPGLAETNSEILFPLSPKLALRGRADGDETVVNADAVAVAEINSHMISSATRQVYADDHVFKYARGEPRELKSGATLLQDEDFMSAGKPVRAPGHGDQ